VYFCKTCFVREGEVKVKVKVKVKATLEEGKKAQSRSRCIDLPI
jgi:hypothetical protein